MGQIGTAALASAGFARYAARMLGKDLFYSKRAHANTRWFNDREMSGPIGPFNNPGGKTGADLRYGRHW